MWGSDRSRRGSPLVDGEDRSTGAHLWTSAAAATVTAVAVVFLIMSGRQAAPEQPSTPVISASGPLLPAGAIRFIAVDGQGAVWFRVANRTGGRDRVTVIGGDGSRRDYSSLRAVVELQTAAIKQAGSLPDFWAVDGSGRVWVGPAYYDDPNWVEVAQDRSYPDGGISYEERVAIDTAGNSWVPYRITNECPMGGVCSSAGLAGFNAAGDLVREITFPEVAELAARDLPQLRFVTLADGRLLAVAARTAFALPDATAIDLPGFAVDPNTGRRDAGFVSAATSHGTDAAVFAWRDPTALGAAPVVAELRGYQATWQSTDLKSCPLLRAGTDGRFVTAADYGEDDLLWLASSDGELSARRADAWAELFTAENSPLGAPVRALAIDDRGALWVGTARGALMYWQGVWHTSMMVHLPMVELSRCALPVSGAPPIVGKVDTPGIAMDVEVDRVGHRAYVADGDAGLQIIDVSVHCTPGVVGRVDTPGEARSVQVVGSLAYVADWQSGLQVIDISEPSAPRIVGSVDTPDVATAVHVVGSLAYVAGLNSGMQVIDISAPTAPRLVGAIDTPGKAEDVQVVGTIAFVADGASGLQLIDVSVSSAPRLLDSFDTPGFARKLHVVGSLVYVADGSSSGLQVIDVSRPSSLRWGGSILTPGNAWDVKILGNRAYVADADSGLQVVDVSVRGTPRLVEGVDTPGSALGVHVVEDLAYVADGSGGLLIIRPEPSVAGVAGRR